MHLNLFVFFRATAFSRFMSASVFSLLQQDVPTLAHHLRIANDALHFHHKDLIPAGLT